jgi:hypothetical protein
MGRDDELTSMVVSTRSLNREPSTIDCRHITPSISSKIKYYRRSVNNITGFKHKWKKCHERNAIGFIKDSQDNENFAIPANGSFIRTPGIFRTSDIKCFNKNYTLSTFSLKDDQINYKARETTILLPRYQNISIPTQPVEAVVTLRGITGSEKISTITNTLGPFFIKNYQIPNRKYQLQSSNFHFIIHKKINNYYYEDNSYKTIYGFQPDLSRFYVKPGPLPYTIFSNADSVDADSTFGGAGSFFVANKIREVLCSRMYSTTNSFVAAVLYNFYETGEKKLNIYRAPFYTNDENTVFRYFEYNPKTNSIEPSTVGHGFIKYFTTSDIPELNTLTYFNLFGTNSIFFICTPTYTVVFTLSSSTFIKFNTNEDFSKAQFYSNANGEFFLLNGKIFKYNSTSQQIIQQTLVL